MGLGLGCCWEVLETYLELHCQIRGRLYKKHRNTGNRAAGVDDWFPLWLAQINYRLHRSTPLKCWGIWVYTVYIILCFGGKWDTRTLSLHHNNLISQVWMIYHHTKVVNYSSKSCKIFLWPSFYRIKIVFTHERWPINKSNQSFISPQKQQKLYLHKEN